MSNKIQKKGFTHDSVDNKTVDWYTPKWIFDALGEHFDLDPCQPEDKIPWIPCDRHYSIIDNGLMQPWDGFVWLIHHTANTRAIGLPKCTHIVTVLL